MESIKNALKTAVFATLPLLAGLTGGLLTSCSDYFETDTKVEIQDGDYIKSEDEVYRGFLGILNRVQEAGDHAIFLLDTRSALLETTEKAPVALQSIYNFDDTDGNEYADPTCYYAIVTACNDYIAKMAEYERTVGGVTQNTEANFPKLLSATLRLKVWAYLQIGRIYGKAYWYDDPLTEKKSLSNTDVFTLCNMKELTDKCIALLENGMDVNNKHISADLTPNWYTWLNEEDPVKAKSDYPEYQYLLPPAVVLNAELRSWRASYIDETAAQGDWAWIREHLLAYINGFHLGLTRGGNVDGINSHSKTSGTLNASNCGFIYQLTMIQQSDAQGSYFTWFFTEDYSNTESSTYQIVSSILYDYDNKQKNRIMQYFCPEYPDDQSFYLKPSEYTHELYPESDIRGPVQKWIINTLGGKECVSKYYYGYNYTTRVYNYLENKELYKIEPAIPMFRGHDLHFLLAEAEAHLGHFEIANLILNNGFNSKFRDGIYPYKSTSPDSTGVWDYRYRYWALNRHEDETSAGGYADLGIAGAAAGNTYKLPVPGDGVFETYTNDQVLAMYDWALAAENQKEYMAEGKSYSYMVKIAERYANPAYRGGNAAEARADFAALIAPKYKYQGKDGLVSARIQSQGYWINWDLKDMK
jgi:hypothetical protein